MDTLHARADWESVGDRWFRKTQQYTAVFDQDLDLDNYIVTGAPYAGALGKSFELKSFIILEFVRIWLVSRLSLTLMITHRELNTLTLFSALWRDDTKLLAYQPGRTSKPAIDIYSLAGKKIRSIPWDKGAIKGLGWSEDETLLVVTADGTVRCYDLQGDFTQFSLGHGADNYGVESCRYASFTARRLVAPANHTQILRPRPSGASGKQLPNHSLFIL